MEPAVSPRLARLLRGAMWVFVAWVVIEKGIVEPAGVMGVDFGKHWLAARALWAGASVYRGHELYLGFNYPQWTAFVYFWLGFWDRATAERIWEWVNLGLLLGCFLIIWRGLRPGIAGTGAAFVRYWALFAAFTLAVYQPASSCIFVGNVDPYNAVLALAMTAALLRGRDRTAGVFWMMLVLCKLLPATLGVLFLFWRRWRVFEGAFYLALYYALLLVATGRLGDEVYFVRGVIPEISYHWKWISMSLPRGLLILGGGDYPPNDRAFFEVFTMGVLAALGLIECILLGWMARRRIGFDRALELALMFVPLLAPLLEYHHFVYSLPSLYLQFRRWHGGGMRNGFALYYAALWLNMGIVHTYLDLWTHRPVVFDLLPLYTGCALLIGMIVEVLFDRKTREST